MYNCGTFYVDGGFRTCVAKTGNKWAYLVYLKADKVKCRRIKRQKTGIPKPIYGAKPYSIQDLAKAFLKPHSHLGTKRKMAKHTRNILNEVIDKGVML